MNRHTIDAEPARKVPDALAPSLVYLNRLRQRLLEVGFPPADHLVQLANKAFAAVQGLCGELHYQSCHGGVGRKANAGGDTVSRPVG